MNDYASFARFAETGPLKIREDERASWFSHKAEEARPYSYKVYLADYDVTAEVTPTERAAQFRFTFPKSDDAHIILDALDGGSMVKIGRAHVCTPVTNAHLVCRPLPEKHITHSTTNQLLR